LTCKKLRMIKFGPLWWNLFTTDLACSLCELVFYFKHWAKSEGIGYKRSNWQECL